MTTASRLAVLLRPHAADLLERSLLDAATEHGVAPLIYRTLHDSNRLDAHPTDVRERLAQTAREAAILEPVLLADLRGVLDAFAGRGIRPLLFKGTALAYRWYPEPWLRPRIDTDLLVRPHEAPEVSRILEELGFTRIPRPVGDHVTHQFTYVGSPSGVQTAYDIHWKIADPQVFADVFSYAELEREAVAVPSIGSHVRTLTDVHALLMACLHRVAHHYDPDTLIFLYDIHLLAGNLNATSWARVAALAAEKQIVQVTARGLRLCRELFDTPVPATVFDTWAGAPSEEPTAAYLTTGLRKVDMLVSDLRTLTSWAARLRLLREHLFPPSSYILRLYGYSSRFVIPALYLHRVAKGAAGWFRPVR